MRYRVSHRTTYSYDDDVSSSFGLAHCRPRELPWQQVASRPVSIDPVPSDITDDTDCYGNIVSYFHVTEPHMRLTIDALSEVTVVPTEYDADALLEAVGARASDPESRHLARSMGGDGVRAGVARRRGTWTRHGSTPRHPSRRAARSARP